MEHAGSANSDAELEPERDALPDPSSVAERW
jgi:hypothetical protein